MANRENRIKVREITSEDIERIADYWIGSDPKFLESMGVDLSKLPDRGQLTKMLMEQIAAGYDEKKSFALIWECDGLPVGHCNINEIDYGNCAKMHLHIWDSGQRKKGIGTAGVKMSLPFYFRLFQLKEIICEPYALNAAPNKTLKKAGFEFIRTYRTIPGSLNFEQEVNQWKITRQRFAEMRQQD